ncbi:MAG: hypothetical protein KDD67_08780 [Ignavibacteriae bacterium]|nr:hypothetical protein [Ignavibacteriota bacterium]MCB9216764.1 hypothetical protein [Ignavibacteria bacterium]
MRQEAHQTAPKALRFIIGASILLLALMLFSELSCSILGLCTNWFPPARFLGFWEVMGISTALLFASLALNALRRSRLSSSTSSAHTPEQTPMGKESFSQTKSPSVQQRSGGWRPLVQQLSDEEKEHLKIIMEERCFGIGSSELSKDEEKTTSQ